MTSPIVTSQLCGPIQHFTVRNGWQWANIYVRSFGDPDKAGVEVVINSDYGVFGHCWTHIGPDDPLAFLAGLNCDYAMGKLARQQYHRDADVEEIFTQMKRRLVDDVEAWGVTAADGVNVAAAHRASIVEMRSRIEHGDAWHVESLIEQWRDVTGRDDWFGDFRLTVVSEQVTGFWSEIWTPFAEHLRQCLQAAAA